MALSKRLALLGALSVTKPRGLGSSCGLINRRQFSNLTKDAKFGPKVSSDQALAEFRHEAAKMQAPIRESEFKPKRTPDQVSAEFTREANKFQLKDDGLSDALKKLADSLAQSQNRVTAELENTNKMLDKFQMAALVFFPAIVGAHVYLSQQLRNQRKSKTQPQDH